MWYVNTIILIIACILTISNKEKLYIVCTNDLKCFNCSDVYSKTVVWETTMTTDVVNSVNVKFVFTDNATELYKCRLCIYYSKLGSK